MKKINTRYQEIIRLDAMLDEANILHGFHRLFDGFQVIYFKDGKQIADAVEHGYSYGIERKVDCERCQRYRYGAAYVLTKKGVRYG